MRSEDSLRDRLVDVGVDLVLTEGVSSVGLREIARRAGVSHGAPRRYFPTHQALLSAIARRGFADLAARFAEAADDGAPPRAQLRALAGAYVRYARERPGMFALMFRHDLLRGNNIGLREESTPLFGVLVELLTRARLAQPTAGAAALWAGLHGIAQLWHWGTLQVVTGYDTPEPLLVAAVDAHLRG
jgi:AcrR family transcriptional regulator